MTSMSVLDLGVIRVHSFISTVDTGLTYLIFVLVYLLLADNICLGHHFLYVFDHNMVTAFISLNCMGFDCHQCFG